jgi:predicted dehydrogenase
MPTHLTRRQFAKSALAALAFPYIVPRRVLGGPGVVPPSERIAMGFIGIGNQGGGHLFGGAWTYVAGGYLGRDEVQVLGVCDIRGDVRQRSLQRVNDHYAQKNGLGDYKSCTAYVDFRELLARPDIDAVLIATPIHWHAMMTVMAAKAGKDVYCEKPTALTIHESQAMVDAVRRYGRVFQAGTQQRSEYGGKYRIACELVRSGRIGKLKTVYSYEKGGGFAWHKSFAPGKPVPANVDWDLFLGPAPYSPYAGSLDAHMFGFGGINWGQHHFDIVQWGIGADDTGPVEVGKDRMVYANGVEVLCTPYPEPMLAPGSSQRFQGEGGAVFIGTEGKIAVDRNLLLAEPADILRKPLRPDDMHLSNPGSHSGNFLECIRTRQRTICDIGSSHRANSLLLLPGIAEQIGRTLKWDPDRQQFPADDEANRLLSVAYRPPWKLG